MIRIVQGNLLESHAEALVNTVNAVGVMGKGIALQFKKAFPKNFKAYEAACKEGQVRPGSMFITPLQALHGPRYIVNFPTKRHWKGHSRLEDIEAGLNALVQDVRRLGITSIAIPPLGCGLGGLSWSDVKARIETAFFDLPKVEVCLYEPKGAPPSETMPNRTVKPDMTSGKAALLCLINEYASILFDPILTVIEIQKLCYFLQIAGEPLRLKFQKWHYGPYADNLRHVMSAIDGHYISGWGDGPNRPLTMIRLLPNAAHEAKKYLRNSNQTTTHLNSVITLVEGFESPYGMELLGTVHWVMVQELTKEQYDLNSVLEKISNWTDRKSRMFKQPHVLLALERLQELGWTN
ncbi:type II toxin-antitoxin system antitoxin DNA ADP-ribosyl glycohydrolase DarG [Desulfolutivibrio sp.]|uniref:type II toxin-antitoxin system antitoxin DNA ADP-ribosyl glycohydrolase DarG n=1 Tax=Desulfolutivibrio sp. TaxID=2773296 RepID=UPI002F96946B